MELRALVTVAPRFTRSINLERDAMSPAAADGYILTGTARTVLERLAVSLSNATGQRAWTITGPYGSGKSAFGLYLAQLVGSPEQGPGRAARVLLRNQAPDLQALLFDRRQKHSVLRNGYYPILVSGAPGPLIPAILRATSRQIRVALGQGRIPDCVKRAEVMAMSAEGGNPVPGSSLVAGIAEIAQFVISSGRGQGLFFVIDELGKFLEFAAREPAHADIFVLQQLAEATAGNPGLCFVTILHQAFERYASDLGGTAREEWAKVQGRFEDIAFQEPPEQLLDFSHMPSVMCLTR